MFNVILNYYIVIMTSAELKERKKRAQKSKMNIAPIVTDRTETEREQIKEKIEDWVDTHKKLYKEQINTLVTMKREIESFDMSPEERFILRLKYQDSLVKTNQSIANSIARGILSNNDIESLYPDETSIKAQIERLRISGESAIEEIKDI